MGVSFAKLLTYDTDWKTCGKACIVGFTHLFRFPPLVPPCLLCYPSTLQLVAYGGCACIYMYGPTSVLSGEMDNYGIY